MGVGGGISVGTSDIVIDYELRDAVVSVEDVDNMVPPAVSISVWRATIEEFTTLGTRADGESRSPVVIRTRSKEICKTYVISMAGFCPSASLHNE